MRLVDILRRFVSRKSYGSIVRVFKRRTNCGYLSVYSEFRDGKVHRMHIVYESIRRIYGRILVMIFSRKNESLSNFYFLNRSHKFA